MKILLSSILLGAILIYLSLQGIEIGGKAYWVIATLITARDVVATVFDRSGK